MIFFIAYFSLFFGVSNRTLFTSFTILTVIFRMSGVCRALHHVFFRIIFVSAYRSLMLVSVSDPPTCLSPATLCAPTTRRTVVCSKGSTIARPPTALIGPVKINRYIKFYLKFFKLYIVFYINTNIFNIKMFLFLIFFNKI